MSESLSAFQRNTFRYGLRVSDFGGGRCEVMVSEIDTRRQKASFDDIPGAVVRSAPGDDPFPLPPPVDAEAVARKARLSAEASIRRSRSMVRKKCKVMQVDRLLTLTYRENMTDRDRMASDWDKLRRLMQADKRFTYVACLEQQERGAWHMHIALRGRVDVRKVRDWWLSIVGKQNGNIDVSVHKRYTRGSVRRVASYISKYIAKGADVHEAGQKRYWCSRGIDLPVPVVTWFPLGVSFEDAMIAAAAAVRAIGDRAVRIWQSDSLGLVWLSSD